MNRRDTRQRARGLEVIGASAGSGKTHTLTDEVCEAVAPGSENPIRLEQLLAVTFTTKAADELGSRIRRELLRSVAIEQAQALPLAYLGTVHSVCLRLLQQYAIDAGLPPGVEVLADGKSLHLRRVVERTLSSERRQRMEELARRLGVDQDYVARRSNWLFNVYAVMDLVRSNRIDPKALPDMGRRSVDGLLELLPKAVDGGRLDRKVKKELDAAVHRLSGSIEEKDSTATSKRALRTLKKKQRSWSHSELTWTDWVELATTATAVKSRACVEDLVEVAGEFLAHQRFQDELRDFTLGIFDAAYAALSEYDAWKRRRRLVDYVDLLERALVLLDNAEVHRELAAQLELAVVDEFQDTSPLQLSLFVQLHQLAGRSIWVGDRKQCIFEFAGADPRLMRQVLQWAEDEGGGARQLEHNYRSRPGLVRLTSELFSKALAPHGYSPQEVSVAAKRVDPEPLSALPELGVWDIDAGKSAEETLGLALGVQRLLEDPEATPVVDRGDRRVRTLLPGDVAVLVRSNDEAQRLADCLSELGIRSALARPGLLATPEGVLLRAGLEFLLDERNALAMATIDALRGFEAGGPDTWLERVIAAREGKKQYPRAAWAERFVALRERLCALCPSEAVLGVLEALDATRLAARWPEPQQRLANLDALRALAQEYEALSEAEVSACTVLGLLWYFDTAADTVWNGEEMAANDEQATTADEQAVVISTYHRSKGLEWPVVVLSSLGSEPRNTSFGVHLESDRDQFDPNQPLAGRWIRFWPRPFGNRTKGITLFEDARDTAAAQRIGEEEREERARLLYVGMTRARDHLVFAKRCGPNAKRATTTWLDELTEGELPLIGFDGGDVLLCGERWKARAWQIGIDDVEQPSSTNAARAERFVFAQGEPHDGPSYWIAPSSAEESWPTVSKPALTQFERLGERLQVRSGARTDWAAVGDLVHGFLACDSPQLTAPRRTERALRLVDAFEGACPVGVEQLLQAGDRLRHFVEARWPGAHWLREVPVTAIVDAEGFPRKVNGTIDLLLETERGVVLIDHKSYPDPREAALLEAAREYGPQLGAYLAALDAAVPTNTAPRTAQCWIHFPLAGAMVGEERAE